MKDMFNRKVPNPGSDEALDQGCTCAVLDNGHGSEELGKIRGFWITGGCPLHDTSHTDGEKGQIYGVTVAHSSSVFDKREHTEPPEKCWCWPEGTKK